MIHLHSYEQLDASGEIEEPLPDEVPRDDLEHLQDDTQDKRQEIRR